MDAFDADVLIYAAAPSHPLGQLVLPLLAGAETGVGSVLLLVELLPKPLRDSGVGSPEVRRLVALIARLNLLPLDEHTAALATTLAQEHRLRAADAVHLATAVAAGAERFITNNRRDFRQDIDVVDIVYPDDLPDRA